MKLLQVFSTLDLYQRNAACEDVTQRRGKNQLHRRQTVLHTQPSTLSLIVPSPTLGCVSRLTDDVCGFPPGVMELCNHSQTTWQPPQEVWPPLHFCLAVYLLLSAVELIEQGLVVQPRQQGPRGLVWLFAKPCHSSLSAHSAILLCPEARKLAGQEINTLYIILTCWYHLHQKT